MDVPARHISELFEEALEYENRGDAYNAIKLYKKVAKMAPQWAPPCRRLGMIYKYRLEWKPALYYVKKSLAADPGNRSAWWDLGIAATALRKWRLARNVWNKFGESPSAGWRPGPVSVRLSYDKRYEILWADSIDPARAVIQNIPHPDSGRQFRDIILYDRVVSGHHVVGRKRFPVHEELGLYKRSGYQTYSCTLETGNSSDVRILENLCREADLGFEVWSNAARQFSPGGEEPVPEYYDPGLLSDTPEPDLRVALAARRKKHITEVLRSWSVISLARYSDLRLHR